MRVVYEEVIKPHAKVPSNSKCYPFMKENTMVHFVKCPREVKVHYVNGGTSTIQHLHDIIKNIQQSRYT